MGVILSKVFNFVTCQQLSHLLPKDPSAFPARFLRRNVSESSMPVSEISTFLDTLPRNVQGPLDQLKIMQANLDLAKLNLVKKSIQNDPTQDPLLQKIQAAYAQVLFAISWAENKIEVQSGTLLCKDEICTAADDSFFSILVQQRNLQDVTYCDFSQFPRITHKTIETMLQACPRLKPFSFRGIFTRDQLCDSFIIVHNVKILVNKAVLCRYSAFFKKMFDEKPQTQTFDNLSAHPVTDCLNALVDTYNLSEETDLHRLLNVLQTSVVLEIFDVVDKAQNQIIHLLNPMKLFTNEKILQTISTVYSGIETIPEEKVTALHKHLSEFLQPYPEGIFRELSLTQQSASTQCLLQKYPKFPFGRFCLIPKEPLFWVWDNKSDLPEIYEQYYRMLMSREELLWQAYFLQGLTYLISWTNRPKNPQMAKDLFETSRKLNPSMMCRQFQEHVIAKFAQEYFQDKKYFDARNHLLYCPELKLYKTSSISDAIRTSVDFVLEQNMKFLQAVQEVMPSQLVLNPIHVLEGHIHHLYTKHNLSDLALIILFKQAGAISGKNVFDPFFQKEVTKNMPFPQAYYRQQELLEHMVRPNAERLMLMALFHLTTWADKGLDREKAHEYFAKALQHDPKVGERFGVLQQLLEDPETKAFAQQLQAQ